MEVKTKVTDLEVYGNIIEIGGYGGVFLQGSASVGKSMLTTFHV